MSKLCALLCIASVAANYIGSMGLDFPQPSFKVYWNVPTFMCHSYGISFDEVHSEFGILQNSKDQFRGDELAILYDPGIFPALLKDPNGKLVRRNGGVPQEGNLTYHLQLFREHVVEQIADESFRGLGIIDFESWRPIFRQNWASLAPYRDLSIEIEHQRHRFWNKRAIEREAVRRFEKYGRLFMEESLRAAKELRPLAAWGYYAYPYCFNLTPQQPSSRCDPKVLEENDRMSWLFDLQDALFPSVYLRSTLSTNERIGLINGRVNEALRIAGRRKSGAIPVLPYFWYKYQNSREDFLSREDVDRGMREISSLGAQGVVIWGSSEDVNTRAKCQGLRDYLVNVLGPSVGRVTTMVSPPSTMADGDFEISSSTPRVSEEEDPRTTEESFSESQRMKDAEDVSPTREKEFRAIPARSAPRILKEENYYAVSKSRDASEQTEDFEEMDPPTKKREFLSTPAVNAFRIRREEDYHTAYSDYKTVIPSTFARAESTEPRSSPVRTEKPPKKSDNDDDDDGAGGEVE